MIRPRPIGVAAFIIIILGLMPGLPKFPFILLACVLGIVAYLTHQGKRAREALQEGEEEEEPSAPENVAPLLHPDLLGLEVGYGLITMVDAQQGGDLLGRIRAIRRQYAMEMGIIIPPLHIRDNFQLKSQQYSILVKGIEVAGGELMPGHLLAMDQGGVETGLEGIETKEPTFGLQALWIPEKDKERAQFLGYTVVDHSTIVATHLSETIKTYGHELLGRQEVQELLDTVAEKYPKAVEELVPNLLTLGTVQKVLQNLLRERVPVRDLLTIVETLADCAAVTKDSDILTESVRQRLSRAITKGHTSPDGTLPAIIIDQNIEEKISEALQQSDQGAYLALDPALAQKILDRVKEAMEGVLVKGQQPVVLCSPGVRPYLKRLTERFLPKLDILSYGEVEPDTEIRSLAEVRLEENAKALP
jgi:flagellar biosynthesis protein FlhA